MLYAGRSCVYSRLGYTQDSNLTNRKPNPNRNSHIRGLIRTNQTHTQIATLLPEIHYNFRWSVIDLHCPANSQN